MSAVLGINGIFHDPAAAVVVDGAVVAAAEEERFSRRKHGKAAVPFSAWELPEQSARWCLDRAGLAPGDVDAVAYSYDVSLIAPHGRLGRLAATDVVADRWEPLRSLYASEAPGFLQTALPGLDPGCVTFVPHHVAHAASAHRCVPFPDADVLVLDGRGETTSHLSGTSRRGDLEVLASQALPHSIGFWYEELTEHLGFRRSSDEYKVMAMASFGHPAHLPAFRELVRTTEDGGFLVDDIDWDAFARRRRPGEGFMPEHLDLAASVQRRLEEVVLELARWLHARTRSSVLTMAGGVALNCVANSRLAEEGPYEHVWVQPAAGDAGTALGGALEVAHQLGDVAGPMQSAALGREWSDGDVEAWLRTADVPFERPVDLADAVAAAVEANAVVAWFQGRSEYGPRALGHRSLLADPRRKENLSRLNDVKGREQFRPVAPMVTIERAGEIFDGPLPSPYMLFTHRVRPPWGDRIPAVVHVDGTARVQTVDPGEEPLVHDLLTAVERRTGVPVLVNTSLNTAGRPMVDDPRDALECFGAAPVDVLAIGPFLVRRGALGR